MTKWRRRIGIGAALLIVGGAAVAVTHDVSRVPAPRDQAVAQSILAAARVERPGADFGTQVRQIAAVQQRVLAAAPVNKGIAHGRARELSDVIGLGYGLCFDRSRAIETVLRAAGFEVRHAAIYSTEQSGSAVIALATPQVPSHALSEVRTSRGWMLVDSNSKWLGLTVKGEPIDLAELRTLDRSQVVGKTNKVFEGSYTYVYGLYSRHGGFYPPYNPVPDVNWSELAQNLRV